MKVLLTGGHGMLGSSLRDSLAEAGVTDVIAPTRRDLDLRDQLAVREFIAAARPDVVLHAAAKVAGIAAKVAAPYDYLVENLQIDADVIDAAVRAGVPRLVYVASAAVYPARYERPFVETDLLTGALEGANEGYAIAKIAAIKLCQYASTQHGLTYRAVLPSNLYGIHDHFGSADAHLVAAALTKVASAKAAGQDTVVIWGDGSARREFTFAGDLAAWIVQQLPDLAAWPPFVNVGVGTDHSIREYYEAARAVTGWDGEFVYDTDRPTGVPRRLIDSTVASGLGWRPSTGIHEGMRAALAAMSDSITPAVKES